MPQTPLGLPYPDGSEDANTLDTIIQALAEAVEERLPRVLIAEVEVDVETNLITFDNIPQGYEDLELRLTAKVTNTSLNSGTALRFNDDAGANYERQFFLAFAEVEEASEAIGTTQLSAGIICGTKVGAPNAFGSIVTTIFDYSSSTKDKTTHGYGHQHDGSTDLFSAGGHWFNTDPITKITISPSDTDDFGVGSRARLYGLR